MEVLKDIFILGSINAFGIFVMYLFVDGFVFNFYGILLALIVWGIITLLGVISVNN